ncbi:MAG: helix-hairpin-helix domain-containing protein [bacterium]|nr:helix-hairpin-helix domain-containing protein [bacterium]
MKLKIKFLLVSFAFSAITKIDINKATLSDLRQIPGLSPSLARSIIEYRAKVGKFNSIEDLKNVPRMSAIMYEYLKGYLYVEEKIEKVDLQEEVIPEEITDEEARALEEALSGAAEEVEALDRYIDEKLNINTATLEQLLELPGMTQAVARNIIRYRQKQYFQDISELQNVAGVTGDLYAAIRPYIIAEPPLETLSGEFRFRTAHRPPRTTSTTGIFFQPPEFQNPYYIYNRSRIFAGSKAEVGWLLLRRDGEAALTSENINRYFLRKFWFKANDTQIFDRFVAGDYSVLYGQGLVFYNNLSETIRPVRIKPRGPLEDKSTAENSYLRGFAGVKNFGNLQLTIVVSDKNFDALPSTTSPQYVSFDIMKLRDMDGSKKDINSIYIDDKLNEKLIGGRLGFITRIGAIGISFYDAKYNPPIAFNVVEKSTAAAGNVFYYNLDDYFMRGDRNTLVGFDFDSRIGFMQISGEWARSMYGGFGYKDKSGDAFIIVPYFPFGANIFYMRIWSYSTDFHNRLAKSFTLASENDTRNEDGAEVGYQMKKKGFSIAASIAVANVKAATIDTSYDSLNNENSFSVKTILPYTARNVYFELKKQLKKGLELYYRLNQDFIKDWAYMENLGSYQHIWLDRIKSRNRLQLTFEPTRFARYRIRFDFNTYSYPQINQSYTGVLTFAEVKYNINRDLTINSRLTFFDTPYIASKDALKPYDFVYVSQLEPIWDRVLLANTYPSVFELDETFRGRIFYITLTQKLGRNLRLWLKYANKYYPFGSLRYLNTNNLSQTSKVIESTNEEFALQIDYRFGKRPTARRTPTRTIEKEVETDRPTREGGY